MEKEKMLASGISGIPTMHSSLSSYVARMMTSVFDTLMGGKSIVGKVVNAGYKSYFFPHLHNAIKFLLFRGCSKGLTHSHTMTPFDAPGKSAF